MAPRTVHRLRPLRFGGRALSILAALSLPLIAAGAQPPPADRVAPTGRVDGRVVDATTGAGLVAVQVQVVGTTIGAPTDLDGRFRTPPIPVGTHSLVFRRIGFQPVRLDSVRVREGAATVLSVAMQPAAQELSNVQIVAEVTQRTSSAAGLLAIQQKAPVVSDGVSAEQISRTPDADAADAVRRITGISVIDNKFVNIRGMSERYNTTLLNGVELASPEPLRKLVPLDIFPASLLESVVTTKTATPDRPGDFAGGSVELTTKEFPENFVFQFNASQGYNSEATFRHLPMAPRGGLDFLGIDAGRRAMPVGGPEAGHQATERFAESVRNVWTPQLRRTPPALGLGLNVGGQTPRWGNDLGYVLSLTYNTRTSFSPDRLTQFSESPIASPRRAFVIQDNQALVDLGGVFNLSYRIGEATKLGLKTLYTRNAEESVVSNAGFANTNSGILVRQYQLRYAERGFLQSQLGGDHFVDALLDARISWKGTASRATWEEPENRRTEYGRLPAEAVFELGQIPAVLDARFLDDRTLSGQVDVAVPLWSPWIESGEMKVGGMWRAKDRDFDSRRFHITRRSGVDASAVNALPPELAFAPENMGQVFVLDRLSAFAQPYAVSDQIIAYYAMVDVPVLPWIRLVGGLRVEDWTLDLFIPGQNEATDQTVTQKELDPLWSANVAIALTDQMNLRLAGFRSLTRPDPRELSPDQYEQVAGFCAYQGNAQLRRAGIFNGDVRWEWYPRPGEIVSVSGFYKQFDEPIVESVRITESGNCQNSFLNATAGRALGGEIEVRRWLDFLPGVLVRLSVGLNLTIAESKVEIDRPELGTFDPDLALQGQSPLLGNASLAYTDSAARINATVLYNYFDDRVSTYGVLQGAGAEQAPHVYERGRGSLDAKIQWRATPRWSVSLAGANLTNARAAFYQRLAAGERLTGLARPGISASIGVGRDF